MQRTTAFRRHRGLALALALVGCGTVKPAADAAPSGSDAAVSIDAGASCAQVTDFDGAWECMRQAECDFLSRCFFAPFPRELCTTLAVPMFGDDERVSKPMIKEAITAGAITFHPEELGACIDLLAEGACPALLPILFQDGSLLVGCRLFQGTVAATRPCRTPLECSTAGSSCGGKGSVCQQSDVCCLDACADPIPLLGDCTADPNCVPGAHCVQSTCRTGEAGAPCQADRDCDDAFYCDLAGANGTCAVDLAPDAACTSDGQCPGNQLCVGLHLPGATSGTCTSVDQAAAACDSACFGLACLQPDLTKLGTCGALAGVDQPCKGNGDFPCALELFCDKGPNLCKPREARGEACADDSECHVGDFCSTSITGAASGICTGPELPSSPCTSRDQCDSAICGTGSTCAAYPGCF